MKVPSNKESANYQVKPLLMARETLVTKAFLNISFSLIRLHISHSREKMDATRKVFDATIRKHWDLFCEISYKNILIYANFLLKEQVFQLFALQTEFFIVTVGVCYLYLQHKKLKCDT